MEEPVPSISRGPERTLRSCGRRYGILGADYAASLVRRLCAFDAEPPAPASTSRPPLSSSSDSEDDSDITVYDLETETDAPIIGWGRFSDISEPGSPSAAATLNRAVATAAAAVATAEESDSTNRDSEFGMLSTLDLPEITPISSTTVCSSQSLSHSSWGWRVLRLGPPLRFPLGPSPAGGI